MRGSPSHSQFDPWPATFDVVRGALVQVVPVIRKSIVEANRLANLVI